MIARVILIVAMLLGLAGASSLAADPVELNVLMPLTGPLAFGGAEQIKAVRAIETLVNASGGIKGRPLHMVVQDDGSNPQTTVQLVSGLVAKTVPILAGPSLSAACSAAFPIVDRNGPVLFCFSPVARPRPGSYSFTGGPTLEDQMPVILRYYIEHKWTNVAVLTGTDTSGKNFDDELDASLTQPQYKLFKIVAREHMNPTDISIAAQLAHVKSSNAQALLTFVAGTGFGTVLHGLSDAGMDLPVFATGSVMSPGQMQQYRSIIPKDLVVTAFRGAELPDPTARGKTKQAQDQYVAALAKVGYKPNAFTAVVWDPLMTVVDVLRHVGPDATAAQAREYLEQLRGWNGIEGTYDFTSGKQYGIRGEGAALFRWDKAADGWVQVVLGR